MQQEHISVHNTWSTAALPLAWHSPPQLGWSHDLRAMSWVKWQLIQQNDTAAPKLKVGTIYILKITLPDATNVATRSLTHHNKKSTSCSRLDAARVLDLHKQYMHAYPPNTPLACPS